MDALEKRRLKSDHAVTHKRDKCRANAEPPESRLASEFLKRLEERRLAGRVGVRRIGIAAWRLFDRQPENQRDEHAGSANHDEGDAPAFDIGPVHAGEHEAETDGIDPGAEGSTFDRRNRTPEKLGQDATDCYAHRVDADGIRAAFRWKIIGDD